MFIIYIYIYQLYSVCVRVCLEVIPLNLGILSACKLSKMFV